MRFWQKWKVLYLLAVFMLLISNANLNNVVKAEPPCRDQTVCFDGSLNPCLPLPTSLPPVGPGYSGGWGFRIRSSNCGAKKCYWFFACRCGPGLGAGFCSPQIPDATSSNSCAIENNNEIESKNDSVLFGGMK